MLKEMNKKVNPEMGHGIETDFECPKCTSNLMQNKQGEVWCSLYACDYGLFEPVTKELHPKHDEPVEEIVEEKHKGPGFMTTLRRWFGL
jgi:uncharacterized Zn finger protein (UPF0148 family)